MVLIFCQSQSSFYFFIYNTMQTNQIQSLFTAENAQRAKQQIIDHKKPILMIVAWLFIALIAFQAVKMITAQPSWFELLVEKQQNNLMIIGDQLEIQLNLRSERNDLQAQIDALNVQINASKDVVVKAETANQEIKNQMLELANPLPITNTANDKQ